MGQALIELISSFVDISGNPLVDTILFAIIGFISFAVAFGLVGQIFDALGFYDSDVMSGVHWIIRVVVFGTLTYLLVKLFQFIAWLISFPWWVYLIALVVVVFVIVIVYSIKYKTKKSKNLPHVEIIEKPDVDITVKDTGSKITEPVQTISYSRNKCPRCGSRLVDRLGPYGKFIGCSAYPKCTYTRKKM